MKKTKSQVNPDAVNNPFYTFCDRLTQPYALAKQYFDTLVFEIDVYNDSNYFYDFYSKLESKDQDTVYNNMQRLYDATKENTDDKKKEITKAMKVIGLPKNRIEEEWEKWFKEYFEKLQEFVKLQEKLHKLEVLSQLLNIADNYKRLRESVDIEACNYRCKKRDEDNIVLQKKLKLLFWINVLSCSCITLLVNLIMLYIFSRVGSESYIKFIEDNFISTLIAPLVVSISTFIYTKVKILNSTKQTA